MATVGFLHTSHVHVPIFRDLLAEAAPGAVEVHVVDEQVLAQARERGVDPLVERRVLRRLQELAERGPDVIVSTCSTVSGHAERLAPQVGVPVVRIDRPMAEEAVAAGGRVAVVAAVESTLAPTRQLLEECAAAAGTGAVVLDSPCVAAWALFEAGNQDGYLERIARHVRRLPDGVDAVVLAQASMAGAVLLLTDLAVPVFSSPTSAVTRAHIDVGSSRWAPLTRPRRAACRGDPGFLRPRVRFCSTHDPATEPRAPQLVCDLTRLPAAAGRTPTAGTVIEQLHQGHAAKRSCPRSCCRPWTQDQAVDDEPGLPCDVGQLGEAVNGRLGGLGFANALSDEASVGERVDDCCEGPPPEMLGYFDVGLLPRVADELGVEVAALLGGQGRRERMFEGQHDPAVGPEE